MSITRKEKESIFKKHGENEQDSGSVFSQVALFKERIKRLTKHLKNNHKDYGTQRSVQLLVGKRRKLLQYLKNKDIVKYRELIKSLNLRK